MTVDRRPEPAARPPRLRPGLAHAIGLVLAVTLAVPAAAEQSGSVPGTVTVEQSVACLLVDGSYDFGTLSLATPGNPAAVHPSATRASITSCGSHNEDILVRGTDATGDADPPAAWTLDPGLTSSPCAVDRYGLSAAVQGMEDLPGVPLSSLDARFASVLPDVAFQTLGAIFMPCTGSGGGGETMTFSVLYTAVLLPDAAGPLEREPNDGQASATPLTLNANTSASIFGAISPIGDRDTYRVTVPAGTVTVETFDASGADTCAQIDTILEIEGLINNTSIDAFDDDSGPARCSIVSTTVPAGGVLYVTVSDYAGDSVIPGYRLRVTHG